MNVLTCMCNEEIFTVERIITVKNDRGSTEVVRNYSGLRGELPGEIDAQNGGELIDVVVLEWTPK